MAKGTFTLNDGIADMIGFNYFDIKQTGVYGDEEWKKKAELPGTIVKGFEAAVNKNRNKK